MYVSHLQQYKLGPNDDLKAKKVTLLASSYLVMGGGGGGHPFPWKLEKRVIVKIR